MSRSLQSRPEWLEHATDLIYEAALGADTWGAVMNQMRRGLRTGAEALYFLDYRRRTRRYVHLQGFSTPFVQSFREMFYRDDNPCIAAPDLHLPGIVRTDETYARRFAEPDLLERSVYYNEWRRPQSLERAIGCTPVASDGQVLNLSLLRSREEGPFNAEEQRHFSTLARHLTRAVAFALQHEKTGLVHAAAEAAIAHLEVCVLVIDERRRVIYANSVAERLLDAGRPLRLRAGRLSAATPPDDERLDRLVRDCAEGPTREGPANCMLDGPSGRLEVTGLPVAPRVLLPTGGRRAVMLTIRGVTGRAEDVATTLRESFGCTPTEIRIAEALLAGQGPREIARASGISYETARWHVKTILHKTGTSRQAEFIARFLGRSGRDGG